MSTPQTPYDAVLQAARDVTAVETALEAEMLGGALLGSVYSLAETDRGAAMQEFVGKFLAHTSRRRTAPARAIRNVFATLAPDAAGAAKVRSGPNPPRWSAQLGQVRPVGAWAYGDVYGDQTSYLAIFAYDDPELGGGEHAVVVLVDHNIGIVKDLFVSQPGRLVVEEVRKAAEADDLVWMSGVDPGVLRAQVSHHLEITDSLSVLPDEGSLATDRALVGARLASLPGDVALPEPPAPVEPASLVPEFLASPQAAGLDRSTPEADASVQYVVQLMLHFAEDAPDADPLRWSPAVAGLFLLDWVHRRAVLDDDDVATLPGVLRAWVAWCAVRRGLPDAAADATREAIDTMVPELARLHGASENQIPRPR